MDETRKETKDSQDDVDPELPSTACSRSVVSHATPVSFDVPRFTTLQIDQLVSWVILEPVPTHTEAGGKKKATTYSSISSTTSYRQLRHNPDIHREPWEQLTVVARAPGGLIDDIDRLVALDMRLLVRAHITNSSIALWLLRMCPKASVGVVVALTDCSGLQRTGLVLTVLVLNERVVCVAFHVDYCLVVR